MDTVLGSWSSFPSDHCVVLENIHYPPIPPTEGIRISWQWGGGGGGEGESVRLKHFKKYIKFNWKFQRGGGGF